MEELENILIAIRDTQQLKRSFEQIAEDKGLPKSNASIEQINKTLIEFLIHELDIEIGIEL